MSNELTTFDFEEQAVRVMTIADEPWFMATDVCRVLGLADVSSALRGLDDDEKITRHNERGNPRAGIPHTFNIISESGLYALIFTSRKPEAKRFRKWVTSEVLPAIRKTGRYETVLAERAAVSATQLQCAAEVDAALVRLQSMIRFTANQTLGGVLAVGRARAVHALARCEIDTLRLRLEVSGLAAPAAALIEEGE